MIKENNIINAFFIMLFVVLFFYILYIWSALIIPFLIALLFSFAIIWLSEFYKKFRIPAFFSMILSLWSYIFLFWLLWKMINSNIKDVISLLPTYQERLSDLYLSILNYFNISSNVDAYSLFQKIDISSIFSSVVSSVTSIFSNAWVILFYVMFILLEYRYFWEKIHMIFKSETQRHNAEKVINKIKSDVKSYFIIKTWISFMTWLLAYIIMSLVGLDFALFWAMMISLLNFIPNIWSIIAYSFPIVLSLIQFTTFYPLVILSSVFIWIEILMWNIIEPKFMWNKLNLSPLVIIISLWFWSSLWWITWMLLCVPLMVIINIVLSQFESTRWVAILLSQNWELDVYDEKVEQERKSLINKLTKKLKKWK